MEIVVLRLGHRLPRDERISTHVALVARAFGADSVAYTGQHDAGFEDSVRRICANWGGRTPAGSEFGISYEKSAASFIRARKREGFAAVHLTMYGMPLAQKLPDINAREKILVVVGSEQVPREIYELADFNISVTGQPHSEVAALAITLDRLWGGRELQGEGGQADADAGAGGAGKGGFDFGGKVAIEPSERGKRVRRS